MELVFGDSNENKNFKEATERISHADGIMHTAIQMTASEIMKETNDLAEKLLAEKKTESDAGNVLAQRMLDTMRGMHFAAARNVGFFEAAIAEAGKDDLQSAQLVLQLREDAKKAMEQGRKAYEELSNGR